MENVILVIHLFLALAIIGLVLLQRSEGGGLGIGGGGGGLGNFATARGTANFLSRATGICAAAFFATSLILGILAAQHSRERTGLADALAGIEAPAEQVITPEADGETPEVPTEQPEQAPAVPISE